MRVISCQRCGRPRALGHPCPSCGDRSIVFAAPAAAQPPIPPLPVSSKPEETRRNLFAHRLKTAVTVVSSL